MAATNAQLDLRDRELSTIANMMKGVTGVRIDMTKRELVRSRLIKRIRTLGLESFEDYVAHLSGDATGQERIKLIDALTTNQTSFFRDAAHFDVLRAKILPTVRASHTGLRIWSAGCSSGEEPYTLAMLAREGLGDPCDAKILATDISTRVLDIARAARYPESALENVPDALRRKVFEREPSTQREQETMYHVTRGVSSLVHFARLNLMEEWPMSGPFDAIFCRNVMIYFDKPVQAKLVARYATLLRPGGYLFVGLAESLTGIAPDYKYVQPGAYQKC